MVRRIWAKDKASIYIHCICIKGKEGWGLGQRINLKGQEDRASSQIYKVQRTYKVRIRTGTGDNLSIYKLKRTYNTSIYMVNRTGPKLKYSRLKGQIRSG